MFMPIGFCYEFFLSFNWTTNGPDRTTPDESAGQVGARYNSPEHKYKPWMLTSTMIEEEDEDDLVERSSGVNLTPTALHTSQAHEGGNCQNGTTVPGAPYAALQGCQASRLAVIAASHVATATRKLLKGLLRSGHHRHSCGQQYLGGHAGFPELGNKAVVSAKATAAPVTTPAPAAAPSTAPKVRSSCRTAATADKRSRQSGAATAATANDRKPNIVGKNCRHERRQHLHCQHVHHVNNRNQHHVRHPHLERSAQQVSTRLQKQPTNRRRSQEPQPQPPRGSHLVRLMDGDDVRLAMQALQLAAQIHDHVWGPDGAPPCNREALLDAASPLYDTAMAAARAIQHRALHALVKQAVRRYVNPYHGSPDDVLQVILELLTGCGGTAAPKPALTVMTAICNTTAQRCLSDVDSGHRGSVGRAAREQSGSSLLTPLERSSTLFASRSSPNGPHQRVSCGSSLGSSGRLSTPSSLDSNGSDSSLHVTLGMRN
ncbi:hypothetical protein Vretimale_14213 [Volvox reticuliferus]|uniref:Uncharacterized protein n=1 Tax=Volvox reticuliferus TaxID=1737510 RepID=A0A8J4CNW4_9CHLO|nr:hypothetical protein Vretifemale_15189 [Volvox reticuliferus]GIM10562.1 hypothetical protein Vretimale_14213 [Volvox reticuliferus]